MKIIKESKEKLPIDFITQFVSKGWEEVGNLKASIEGIKREFKETKDVENILQDLVDAYLIAIGQMELHLDKKDYVELPDKEELKEALTESSPELAQPIEAKKFETEKCVDGKCCKKTEIFTELPDYDVEVEQKGDKIEIELEPKEEKVGEYLGSGEMVGGDSDDEWPEPDMSDTRDIDDAKTSIRGFVEVNTQDNPDEEEKKEIPDQEFDYFVDFDEPESNKEEDEKIRKIKQNINN